MASSCVLRMCQMRSKSCNGDGLAMHGRFPDGHPSKLLISLSLLSKISDCRQSAMSSPWNRCDVLSFRQPKPQKPQKCPNSGFRHPRGMIYPQKDFDAFWTQFWLLVEAYTLARPSVHTCIAIFRPSGHWACPCATFFKYREAHYPFRFSSDGDLTR